MAQAPVTTAGFTGNACDLAEFLLLRDSPLHSAARGDALMRWQAYNTLAVLTPRAKAARKLGRAPARKGDHVYTARHVDLSGADLGLCVLGRAKMRGAVMNGVYLEGSKFKSADFRDCQLRGARLGRTMWLGADLVRADLRGADIRGASFEAARLDGALMDANTQATGASFVGATLSGAQLAGVDLSGCDLRGTSLVRADLRGTSLVGARVYGCAAWDLVLDEDEAVRDRLHADLSIDPGGAPLPSAPNLELAQFVSLLLNNPRLRDVIDTISQRGVLLLGRFTPERKAVLDALRNALRGRGLYPMMCDFPPPGSRDTRETVKVLAGLSAFVIADVSDASSVPLELGALVTDYLMPFVIIKQKGRRDFGMLNTLYTSGGERLSSTHVYDDSQHLLDNLDDMVLWAQSRATDFAQRKNQPAPYHPLPRRRP